MHVADKVKKASRASSAVDRPTQAEDGHWYVIDPQENNWVHSDHGTWDAPTIETAPEMYSRVPTPQDSDSDDDSHRPIQVPDKSPCHMPPGEARQPSHWISTLGILDLDTMQGYLPPTKLIRDVMDR